MLRAFLLISAQILVLLETAAPVFASPAISSEEFPAWSGGHSLQIIAPDEWQGLRGTIFDAVQATDLQLRSRFGPPASMSTTIELVDEARFRKQTGAPSWITAIFVNNRILVRIPGKFAPAADAEDVVRSVRHEYAHAFNSALSNGRCPGWLDEGVAQWAEGPINPLLQTILANHLRDESAIPMSYLQQGFIKLDPRFVAPAYAQSLFAVSMLVKAYGFSRIATYLGLLQAGTENEDAFEIAFNSSYPVFEDRLDDAVKAWARSYFAQPADSAQLSLWDCREAQLEAQPNSDPRMINASSRGLMQ